jgi:hypothetical protein
VFKKNQFSVNGGVDVNYGEEDHLDLATGSLYLKTQGKPKDRNTEINVKLEYSHDFTFSGTQSTTAYLNIAGIANGSVYIHHGIAWSHCSIGVNIGIINTTQNKLLYQTSCSKSPSDIDKTEHWNISIPSDCLNGQLPFTLDPGNKYYVFVNVVGSGDNYGGDYNYEVDMTLTHLSLTFVSKER